MQSSYLTYEEIFARHYRVMDFVNLFGHKLTQQQINKIYDISCTYLETGLIRYDAWDIKHKRIASFDNWDSWC